MALTVTHTKVAVIPDDGTSEVGSDEWNDAHTISGVVPAANLPAAREVLQADRSYYAHATVGTCTITNASPAVVTLNGHGFVANDPVIFSTTGALPTGLLPGNVYYVLAAGLTANAFEVSATVAGAAINTSGAGSGVHSACTGTDSGTGLTQTRTDAFLTVQKAVDVVSGTLDLNTHDVTINAVGAVAENIVLKTCLGGTATIDPNWGLPTGVKILGDRTTPVLFTHPSTIVPGVNNPHGIDVSSRSPWILDGIKFERLVSNYSFAINTAPGCYVFIGKVEFGLCAQPQGHMQGDVRTTENYTISGGAYAHRYMYQQGLFCDSPNFTNITVTLTGTPDFSGYAFYVAEGCELTANGVFFSGAATGLYMGVVAGTIQTYGFGQTYCPGNTASYIASGGQII